MVGNVSTGISFHSCNSKEIWSYYEYEYSLEYEQCLCFMGMGCNHAASSSFGSESQTHSSLLFLLGQMKCWLKLEHYTSL